MISVQKLLVGLCTGLLLLGACARNNNFATDGTLQPTPQSDTIKTDTLLSKESSATYRFLLYNRNKQPIRIERIKLLHGISKGYRINVDGRSGEFFEQIPLQPGDSLFVLLEATYPQGESDLPTLVSDSLLIRCNGVSRYVTVLGYRQNAERLQGVEVTSSLTLTAQRPYIVEDSIVVHPGAQLILEAGTRLLMRQGARMVVHGSLISNGTVDKRVQIKGLRTDHLIPSVPYFLVPGQWKEIFLSKQSFGNRLQYTTICNGTNGIICQELDHPLEQERLFVEACRITNMTGTAVELNGGTYQLLNSELSNTGSSTLLLRRGKLQAQQLSIVNLFAWERRTAPAFSYAYKEESAATSPSESEGAEFVNCIIDGSYALTLPKGFIGGGEVWLQQPLASRCFFKGCYLRTSLPALPFSGVINCVEAKALPKDVYRLTGIDYGNKKYHFYYDFRPLTNTPVTQMPQELQPLFVQDLSGALHTLPLHTAGALAPVDSLTSAPWWHPAAHSRP